MNMGIREGRRDTVGRNVMVRCWDGDEEGNEAEGVRSRGHGWDRG